MTLYISKAVDQSAEIGESPAQVVSAICLSIGDELAMKLCRAYIAANEIQSQIYSGENPHLCCIVKGMHNRWRYFMALG